MKVLVTGGCGLVGFHAAKYYKDRGHDVDVMDNLERSSLLGHEITSARKFHNFDLLEGMGVHPVLLDVSKEAEWNLYDGHDVIIHMAGQCGVPTSIENPRRDFEVNTVGTLNMLEYARRHNAKVVLASTNKVYPLHEGFSFNPDQARWEFENPQWREHGFPLVADLVGARTPYGNSKMTADLLCQEWAHTYGVRTGVFRMSCIYGPAQMGFEEQGWAVFFIIALLKGWPITIYGDGAQVRDMLYVEDCVRAYDAFVQSDISHGVWNLGGGPENTLSLNEHLDTMRSILAVSGSELSFADWRPLDQKCYVSDIRKIKSDLNWAPTVAPQEGLALAAEWVRQNLHVF